MSYDSDRAWSDRYIGAIRQIVGPLLLEPASFEVDTKQATDLVVLRARDHMIAARIRRSGYADRYPYEFTIRSHRDSGARTELEKLVDGWGDWFFYGHADADNQSLSRWMVIDLHSWRAALIRDGMRNASELKWVKKSNFDGTHFVAFDVRSFPSTPQIVVSASHEIQFRDQLAA
jgi:hypothetical protein